MMNNIRRNVLLQLARSTRIPIALGLMIRRFLLQLFCLLVTTSLMTSGDADYVQL